MLTEVVRDCLHTIPNRFELVVITADRCRQLLDGARATVDNPDRERMPKIALREVCDGKVVRNGDSWKVDRPGFADLFKDEPDKPKAAKASAKDTDADDSADEAVATKATAKASAAKAKASALKEKVAKEAAAKSKVTEHELAKDEEE